MKSARGKSSLNGELPASGSFRGMTQWLAEERKRHPRRHKWKSASLIVKTK